MKIMVEAQVYHQYKNIIIAIDGDGQVLNVSVSKIDAKGDIYYGDGLTIDTNAIIKET